jgi:hypothetical protein
MMAKSHRNPLYIVHVFQLLIAWITVKAQWVTYSPWQCAGHLCVPKIAGKGTFLQGTMNIGYDNMVNSNTLCEETNWKSLFVFDDISTYQNLSVLRFSTIFWCHLVPCVMTTYKFVHIFQLLTAWTTLKVPWQCVGHLCVPKIAGKGIFLLAQQEMSDLAPGTGGVILNLPSRKVIFPHWVNSNLLSSLIIPVSTGVMRLEWILA